MKAQVTLFIIIGLVMIIALGITLYATSFFISRPKVVKTGVKDFVVDCLKQASEKSFKKLGANGGYISKENVKTLTTTAGKEFVVLESKPSHDIACNKEGKCWYYYLPPEYPWPSFPYKPNTKEITFAGYFGDSELLTFKKIKSDLEDDISKNLKECVDDFESFRIQGIDVKPLKDNPNVSIVISNFTYIGQERFTTINLRWPLRESAATTKTYDEIFSIKLPFRLSTIYYAAEQIVNNDISTISYSPSMKGMKTEIKHHYGFSVINITDPLSNIFGENFEFRFARENRNPGLWFIEIPNEDLRFHVVFKDDGSEVPTEIKIEDNLLIFEDPCPGEKDIVIELNASDADDEKVEFKVEPEKLYIKDNGRDVKVSAVDKSNDEDFQLFKVEVAGCVRR